MESNFNTLLHFWEKNPERFFVEWRRSIADGTLSEQENSDLLRKVERAQPIDYARICKVFKLDPTILEHKILCHHIGRGDYDEIM